MKGGTWYKVQVMRVTRQGVRAKETFWAHIDELAPGKLRGVTAVLAAETHRRGRNG